MPVLQCFLASSLPGSTAEQFLVSAGLSSLGIFAEASELWELSATRLYSVPFTESVIVRCFHFCENSATTSNDVVRQDPLAYLDMLEVCYLCLALCATDSRETGAAIVA
jgi:hypothetical protein